MYHQVYKYLVMTKKWKSEINFTYPNPAIPPIWKIRNETMYAVTKVIAHMVNGHL